MWTKGGEIDLSDNPFGTMIGLILCIGILFFIFSLNKETRNQNRQYANEIVDSQESEMFYLEKDFVVTYISFATSAKMEFVIDSGAVLKELNEKCLIVFKEELPNEIKVKYGIGGDDSGYRIVIDKIIGHKKPAEEIVLASYKIRKKY